MVKMTHDNSIPKSHLMVFRNSKSVHQIQLSLFPKSKGDTYLISSIMKLDQFHCNMVESEPGPGLT